MWYLVMIGLAALTFFFSPWEPLLQASSREDVRFREVQSEFDLYTGFRLSATVALAALPCLALYMLEGPWFIVAFAVPFAALYAHDFMVAQRLVKQHCERLGSAQR